MGLLDYYLFITNKIGSCPNCGSSILLVEEIYSHSNNPRRGSPVYCPECDMSGKIGKDLDLNNAPYSYVKWYGA